MKKQLLIPGAAILLATLLISATIRRSSSGAPPSHTGAPGEQTCATSGCHDDTTPNIGSAKIDLQFGENETTFVPGQTYSVKVRISDPKVTRFGFQLLALESKTLRDVGNFTISDSVKTQIVTNMYKLKDRNYVTYTFAGTDAVSEGNGEWTVKWTAPADVKKGVTFYLAAVSANDDMTDKGDKVYTTNYTYWQRN
jgi:hypothetical protein